ncbi:MAG: hypothetical protein K2J80_12385 [Oscillospiraceae bacterium]|nr:hypothetical protein [Oscillospiraceae bacterium]
MENTVNIPNRAVLPYAPSFPPDADELLSPEPPEPASPASPPSPTSHPEHRAPIAIEYDPDEPREHVRAPELHRHGVKLLMAAAAVIGAAAGARLILGDTADALKDVIAHTFSGTFWEKFLRQTALSAVFLGAEFVLGFFALGDLVIWTAPFFCAMGIVLRLSAGSPKLLFGAVVSLGAIVLGAAYSADMSELLLRLTRGGTVYMEARPRRSYALGFLGCLAACLLGSILTAALA